MTFFTTLYAAIMKRNIETPHNTADKLVKLPSKFVAIIGSIPAININKIICFIKIHPLVHYSLFWPS